MATVRLKDRDGKDVLVLNNLGSQINSTGVLLFKGDFYMYHSYEVQEVSGELILIFTFTNIMEIK